MTLIYKIAPREAWEAAEKAGEYRGAPIDLADGFIHFSAAEQVEETLTKHFAGLDDLVVAAIDSERLGSALKWEPSRGGQLFPHLYGRLALDAVVWVRPVVDGQLPNLGGS